MTRRAFAPSLLFAAALLATACGSSTPVTPAAVVPPPRDTHELLDGTLYMQTAAEYETLCRIAYAQALTSLDVALDDRTWTAALEQKPGYDDLPPAIVLDLDETVLDNSRAEGQLVKTRAGYNDAVWNAWVARAEATLVPGARELLSYAASRGVTIFYVTNRTAAQETDTRKNLASLSLPLAVTPDVVLTKGENGWTSDKSARRAFIASRYRILLLVGDDLGDFVSGAKDTPANRAALARSHAQRWGKSWILLPNPLYGSWESALYDHDFALPDATILEKKRSQVRGF